MSKLTFVLGLALGYVLGTRAGREQYEKMLQGAKDLSQNPSVQSATANAKQAAESAAGKVSDKLPSSLTEKVPYLREHSTAGVVSAPSTPDAWDTPDA